MFDRLRRTFKSWFRIGQIDERPGSNLASDGGETIVGIRQDVHISPFHKGEAESSAFRRGEELNQVDPLIETALVAADDRDDVRPDEQTSANTAGETEPSARQWDEELNPVEPFTVATRDGDEGQEDARSVVTASPVLAGESEPLSNRVGGDGEISANLSPNLPKVDIVFATKDLLEQAERLEKSAGPWAFRLGMTCRLLDRAACRMALERLSLIDPMAADYERRQLEEASADKLISRQFGERPAELTSISN